MACFEIEKYDHGDVGYPISNCNEIVSREKKKGNFWLSNFLIYPFKILKDYLFIVQSSDNFRKFYKENTNTSNKKNLSHSNVTIHNIKKKNI